MTTYGDVEKAARAAARANGEDGFLTAERQAYWVKIAQAVLRTVER